MTNSKFNFIFAGIDVLLVIVIALICASIYRVEQQKKYFHMEDIINTKWQTEDGNVKFEVTSSRITLKINDEDIIDNKSFELNEQTGELTYLKHEGILYIRSISNNNLVLWYDKHEYRLVKQKIYK